MQATLAKILFFVFATSVLCLSRAKSTEINCAELKSYQNVTFSSETR